MVAINVERESVMDRRRARTMRAWIGCVITAVIGLAACTRPQDSMLTLSDRIEDEADSLRWSRKADATFLYSIETEAPWMLMFVPRKGFDGQGAARAGVRDELRSEILRRSEEWGGAALIVYATPRGTSITRLADKIDVREQVVLQGEPGKIEIAVELSRAGEAVSISRVTTRRN
jgi:hypothetical protein